MVKTESYRDSPLLTDDVIRSKFIRFIPILCSVISKLILVRVEFSKNMFTIVRSLLKLSRPCLKSDARLTNIINSSLVNCSTDKKCRIHIPTFIEKSACKSMSTSTSLGEYTRSEEHTSELQSRFDLVC